MLLVPILIWSAGCGQQNGGDGQAEQPAAETEPPAPSHGGAMIEGTIGDAENLIPALSSDSASGAINGLVYNGLITADKDLNLEGDLAESWDISEDGRTITFHLRKGVRWHDGEPFTSKDVMFTYELMIDPQTPTAYGEDFKQVEKAEAPDDYTFRVTYPRPYAPALITWAFSIMPAHLLEGQDVTTSPLARHPIGTGPYIFKEWETGQRIVLDANPDYFEGEPYIQRVIYRVIPDQATMFLELKNQSIDLMSLTPAQYTRQTDTKEFKRDYNRYKYLANGYTYLGFNLDDPKFKSRKVRQAIAYAIDKKEIIQGVLFGLGRVANGPYKPGTWPYNPNVENYPFDPDKARELLAEAGWTDTDNDGLVDRMGQNFEFTIITNQGNKMREQTAVIIQHRLKDVGIAVKVRQIEWAAFLKEFVDKKNFEALILSWSVPQLNHDLFDVWHSSKTQPGELNFVSYKNEEVDELIDQARFTFDRETRKEAYWRIQEILMEEVPYVFLYVPDALLAVAARIHGIEPAPAGIKYNFIEWYIPEDQQRYSVDEDG
jgi:peptide/nickel transport system substrate-binding protein